jgi:hypothetical protein
MDPLHQLALQRTRLQTKLLLVQLPPHVGRRVVAAAAFSQTPRPNSALELWVSCGVRSRTSKKA